MRYYHHIILTVMISIKFGQSQSTNAIKDTECCLKSNNHISHSTINQIFLNESVIIKNFNSLNELNFNCSGVFLKTSVLIFIPNSYTLMDNTFNLVNLLYSIKFTDVSLITFFRLKGLNFAKYKKIYKYLGLNEISLQFSQFQFYLNESLLDESLCKSANFNDTRIDFFGSVTALLADSNNYYSRSTCPYAFMNTKLKRLTLSQISNSLILKNQLKFIEINQKSDFDLNNQEFYYLNIGFAYEKVTLDILNRYVFKYIKRLVVCGIIYDIQTDLFSHFKSLKFLALILDNFKQLLENNNNWLKYLNSDVKVNLTDLNEVNKNLNKMFTLQIIQKNSEAGSFTAFSKSYKYPDEDFCLFKEFPHENLVYPFLLSGALPECTCTIFWLIQNSDLYFKDEYTAFKVDQYVIQNDYLYQDSFFNHTGMNCLLGIKVKKSISSCRFEDRLKLCDKTNYKYSESFQFKSDIDVLFLIKWVQLVVFVFLQPILCTIGMTTNALSVLTLRHELKYSSVKGYSMYKHIIVNSTFNFIYCAITLAGLINICVFDVSIFCSKVYQDKASQYFKIIVIYFLGNFIKLCCNISYISFALSRLFLSTENKNKFNRINLKFYYCLIFVFCFLLSIFRLFEYDINEIEYSYKNFPFQIYDVGSCEKSDFHCALFRALNILNDLIKNVLFFVINLVLDLVLFKNSKQNLRNKKKLCSDRKQINLAIKSKNSINQMLFVNALIFFVSYFPEFIANILLIVFDQYLNFFCFKYLSCRNLTELSEVFNFISISFQFFVYKRFNKHFNNGFKTLKKNVSSKLDCILKQDKRNIASKNT